MCPHALFLQAQSHIVYTYVYSWCSMKRSGRQGQLALSYNKSITVQLCKGCSGITTVSFRVSYKLKGESIGRAEILII